MTLSIIIVNYNVKFFLEQCLHSVAAALRQIEGEVIVIDNHSTDESLAYLAPKFPAVRFITNPVNSGFGKACNLGLEQATGRYILFLNPDTIIAEDCLDKSIRFMDAKEKCGALGVKMVDGSGQFLKESKRAFPSPFTSLFKLFGLSRLFPHSKTFSRYHLGHLSKNENHEVDVLAGAYMMVRRHVLDEIGSFDESFFMYGEDVDLSYRIQQAGYKNFYLAETTIIHFKGESTKRGSLNYVRMFYQAMNIFVRKHYGGVKAGVFTFSIQAAIFVRAVISIIFKLVRWVGIPVIDAAIILLSFFLVKELWVAYIRTEVIYPDELLLISFPLYSFVYLAAAYYAGLYDRFYKTNHLVRSTLVATVTLLVIYALLPEELRFSRGMVLFGAFLAFLLMWLQRNIMLKAGILQKPADAAKHPHILVAATDWEFTQVVNFLQRKGIHKKIIGRVGINGKEGNTVAHLDGVQSMAAVLHAKDLLFCVSTLSYKKVIDFIERERASLKYRFHACGSCSIVGSDTSSQSGEILSSQVDFAIEKASNKRLKRLVDVVLAIIFLLSFPIHILLVNRPLQFLINCLKVLAGRKTWIGYSMEKASVPKIRDGVIGPNGKIFEQGENSHLLAYWYARNYEPWQDVKTIFDNYQKLGN